MKWEDRKEIDPEQAVTQIFYGRDLLEKVRAADVFEKKRNLLAIAGYRIAKDEDELEIIVGTLSRAVYPSRSGGIY